MPLCQNRALSQLVITGIYGLTFQLSQGGSKCLHVNISCTYTIVQVAVLFLQDKLLLYSQRVFKKIAVNPIPAHELIPGEVLSQVPPQLSLAAAESQKNMKAKSSSAFKGNSDIKMNPMKSHLREGCKILSLSNGKSSSSPATYTSR